MTEFTIRVAVPFCLLGIALIVLLVEAVLIHSWRKRITIRVHVNGTRGKSSVTRYIAAGLRANGRSCLAKVTGIVPTVFGPDGAPSVIRRRGPANVREQIRMLRRARRQSCDSIVLECMSVAPALQQIETRILRPHCTVITNILDDHREELGHLENGRVSAYCSSLPRNAVIVSGENEFFETIAKAGKALGSSAALPPERIQSLIPNLPPGIHSENVALALTVLDRLGMDLERSVNAILKECSDGVESLHSWAENGKAVRFVNGFAVNDVPSAESFMELWKGSLGGWTRLILVLNSRPDRPYRTVEFARWCAGLSGLDRVVLIGGHSPMMKRELLRRGFPESKILKWSRNGTLTARTMLNSIAVDGTVVFGLGNIAGDGFKFIESIAAPSAGSGIA